MSLEFDGGGEPEHAEIFAWDDELVDEIDEENQYGQRDVNNLARDYIVANDADDNQDPGDTGGEGPAVNRHLCGCKRKCVMKFETDEIEKIKLNTLDMSREERDIFLGVLHSFRSTTLQNAHGKERSRDFFNYSFKSQPVRVGAFEKIYGIGHKYLRNLRSYLQEHGQVPRKYRRPSAQCANSHHGYDCDSVYSHAH